MEIYAIIASGGKQYQVSLGNILRLDKLDLDGDTVTFDQVLLVQDGKAVSVGQPLVEGATVIAKVVNEEVKGKKLRIFRYKAKSRHRRTKGYRHTHTDLQVIEIAGNKLAKKLPAAKNTVAKDK